MRLSHKTVELLLIENVDNLGIVGDVVEVKPGYARNYLLPMGLATVPTEEAKAAVAERRAQVEKEMKALRAQKEEMFAKLEDFELTIQRSANEQGVLYGSITQHDISEALQEEGFDIADREVRVGDQIKRLDSYMIPIQLDKDLKTEIKLWVVSDKPVDELEIDEVTTDDVAAGVATTDAPADIAATDVDAAEAAQAAATGRSLETEEESEESDEPATSEETEAAESEESQEQEKKPLF